MNAPQHLDSFRRVGLVLIAAGTLDTLAMAWCAVQGLVYPSTLTVFAIAAGFFLLRGNLSAAALTRWTAALLLALLLAALVLGPWIYPLSLLEAQWRLYPAVTGVMVAGVILPLPLLARVVWQLNQAPVRQALAAEKKCWSLRGAALLGLGLMVVLAGLVHNLLTGDLARQMGALAQRQLGPGFQTQVMMMDISFSARGVTIAGQVVAWKHDEIKTLSVSWQE